MIERDGLPDRAAHLRLGKKGEDIAARVLRDKGYRILARNWRHGKLELDLVCEMNDLIIFVEVKTRAKNSRGGPVCAITESKKLRIGKAAQAWLKARGAWRRQCRFDVICLIGSDLTFRMEHYPNAFDLADSVDSRDANWQSW